MNANEHLRSSKDFPDAKAAAEKNGEDSFVVVRPLKEVYGDDHGDKVSAVTRGGSNNHPTGNPPGSAPPVATKFEDGTMKAVYR